MNWVHAYPTIMCAWNECMNLSTNDPYDLKYVYNSCTHPHENSMLWGTWSVTDLPRSWSLHDLKSMECSLRSWTFHDLESTDTSRSCSRDREPFTILRFHAHALFMLLTTINILKIMNISCSQQIFHAYVLRLLNIPCSWHHIHKSKLKAFLAPVSWSNWPEHWKYFLL